MRRWLIVVVFLAACSGGSKATTTTTTTNTSTTTAPASTVAQVASVIAEKGTKLRDDVAKEDACTSVDCLVPASLIARWTAIATDIRAVQSALDAKQPWPAELADLAQRTSTAFGAAGDAGTAWKACLGANSGGLMSACRTQQDAFEHAFRALPPLLDAWKPFGA